MKIFYFKFNTKFDDSGYIEAPTQREAFSWFVDNSPANTKILLIREIYKKSGDDLRKKWSK